MQQPYFIVVLAHSLHGRLRRVHVPYHAVYAVLALAFIGSFSVFGFVSSYFRMALKVPSLADPPGWEKRRMKAARLLAPLST